MANNVYYTSSNGTVFNLLDFNYAKLADANFHAYSWGKEVITRRYGEIVNRFTKDAQTYSCTFKWRGSPSTRKTLIENFHYCTEYDIAHQTPGRITWGSCYIDCYMITSNTYPEGNGSAYTVNECTFYAPYPFWIEEQVVEIYATDAGATTSTSKGYVSDESRWGYPWSYAGAPTSVFINVDHYADCDFKMVAYGATSYVQWTIDSNIYEVDYALRANQYMVIDSRQNTPVDEQCYVVSESGIITNVFDYRNPNYELFQKIPSGNIILNYARTYGMELTIYKERSEPR